MTDSKAVARPRAQRSDRIVAFHEAGHAVVGMSAGVPLRLVKVSIVPDKLEGSLGHAEHARLPRVVDYELDDADRPRRVLRDYSPEDDPDRWQRQRRLEPRIMVLFGGVIAQRRIIRRFDWVCADSDLRAAHYLLDQMHLSSARTENRYRDYLWAATQDIVKQKWDEIAALASELLIRKTMTGRDVKAFQRSRDDHDVAAWLQRMEQARQDREQAGGEAPAG